MTGSSSPKAYPVCVEVSLILVEQFCSAKRQKSSRPSGLPACSYNLWQANGLPIRLFMAFSPLGHWSADNPRHLSKNCSGTSISVQGCRCFADQRSSTAYALCDDYRDAGDGPESVWP